jgi:hypothetical protein
MCHNAPRRSPGRTGPGPRAAAALLGACLALAWAAPAAADPVKTAPAAPPAGSPVLGGEVIDITGLRERPRGDTRLPWTLPEGFARAPEAPAGQALRDEVLRPVDREALKRLLEVERLLNW